MTRQPKKPAKLPKPVEAWAVMCDGAVTWSHAWTGAPLHTVQPLAVHRLKANAKRDAETGDTIIRVRIVPVQPKKRRVRKEKQK